MVDRKCATPAGSQIGEHHLTQRVVCVKGECKVRERSESKVSVPGWINFDQLGLLSCVKLLRNSRAWMGVKLEHAQARIVIPPRLMRSGGSLDPLWRRLTCLHDGEMLLGATRGGLSNSTDNGLNKQGGEKGAKLGREGDHPSYCGGHIQRAFARAHPLKQLSSTPAFSKWGDDSVCRTKRPCEHGNKFVGAP